MAIKNRFERVSEVQPDAITLSLIQRADGQLGSIIVPASATSGELSEDKTSEMLPAQDAFRSAIRLGNQMKLAVVVMDPDGVWKEEWGQLYTPLD